MPYHASVLPVRASPKDMGGFGDDAFRPLWRKEGEKGWGGFTNGDRR
jgi:3-keto steroid reductase